MYNNVTCSTALNNLRKIIMARTIRKKHVLTEEQEASLLFAKTYFAAFPDDCLLHCNSEIDDNTKFPIIDSSGQDERAHRWYSLHKTREAKATLVQKWVHSKESRTAKADRKLRWFKEHQAAELAYTVIHGPSRELYVIGRKIGRGTFSDVYLAINEAGESFSLKYEKENAEEHGQPKEEKILSERGLLVEPKLNHKITTTPLSSTRKPEEENLYITITPYLGETLTQHIKTVPELSTKERIKKLMAPTCQEHHHMHTGKAFENRTNGIATLDVNANNLVILDDAVTVIDTQTAEENIHGMSSSPTGHAAFSPPEDILAKVTFLQRDILGVMRIGYMDIKFKGLRREYTREELMLGDTTGASYDFIFNNFPNPDDYLATDSFCVEAQLIKLLSVVDIIDADGEIHLVRHDDTCRPFPKSLIELKTKCMLIYLEIDPDILDQIDEDSNAKKALYALAQADIYHKPLWGNLFSLASRPQNAFVLLIQAIANIDIKLLQEKPLIQFLEMVKTPNFIGHLWHKRSKFLAPFLEKMINNNHFLATLIQLEKIGPKFINEKLTEKKELQQAYMVLMQFDAQLFTQQNIQEIENASGYFFPASLKKTHTIIAASLDSHSTTDLNFDGNLLRATLKVLRTAGLYIGESKNKWYCCIENNSALQLSIFILAVFNRSFVTEANIINLMADNNPIVRSFKVINTEVKDRCQFYTNEGLKPATHYAVKALIYLALEEAGENQQAITTMRHTLAENCKQETPTLRPLIELHTELLTKEAAQLSAQAGKSSHAEENPKYYKSNNGSLLPLTNGRQAPPNITAAAETPLSLNG
jgi:serine/threonine protein kinase